MKPKALVVDDDVNFLQIIKVILQRENYVVEVAPSASDALRLVEANFYNVAILDISLPDMEGTELLSQLLEKHPDTIAIMLTGHSSLQNAIQSLNRGAFAYLQKPLDPPELISVISRGLEKQRLTFENRTLLAELEQRNRETNILLSISRAASSSLELPEVMDSALEQVVREFKIAASWVYLLKEGRLTLAGCRGLSAGVLRRLDHLVTNAGLIGEVLEKEKPMFIDQADLQADPQLSCLCSAGSRWYVGVPLVAKGIKLGIMMLTGEDNKLLPQQTELLRGIASEIAMAVYNAQLYEEASSARALRELDALRRQFLANVSHELRTPLAAIKGFASSLLETDVAFDEPTRRDFLQSIEHEADKLDRLIKELLMMSRVEAGALEIEKSPLNLADLADSVKHRLRGILEEGRLRIRIPPDLLIMADAEKLEEVLVNLIENAAKYSPDGSEVIIEAARDGGKVLVSVLDQGIGIPPELHQKVFEPFFQVRQQAAHQSGTGLGLSICRGIIEAHGGRIWVESQPGKGSKFIFALPDILEESHEEDAHPSGR